ncbi:unnamed protein product, partial [Polarella glacialis]
MEPATRDGAAGGRVVRATLVASLAAVSLRSASVAAAFTSLEVELARLETFFNETSALDPRVVSLRPGGPELAALAAEFGFGGRATLAAAGRACLGRGEDALEPAEAEVVLEVLRRSAANLVLRARGAVARLCAQAAPAPMIVLVAGIASRTLQAGSFMPGCRQLAEVVATDRRCKKINDIAMFCLQDLSFASNLVAAVPSWIWFAKDLPVVSRWTYHEDMGSSRFDGLELLLLKLADGSDGAPLLMAEVGVWHAELSEQLLERFSSLRMLLVDPYHLRPGGTPKDQLQGYSAKALDLGSSRTQRYRDRATHVVQASVAAADWVASESVDLVFIDGDHSYEGAASDIAAWWPTVRPGGILAGHDYTLIWPGVVRAVNELGVNRGLAVHFTPEIWWVEKPLSALAGSVPTETSSVCVGVRTRCLNLGFVALGAEASSRRAAATNWMAAGLAGIMGGQAAQAYELPPLGYAYDALEPSIDKATMEFHHDKHHQTYVTNINKALEGKTQPSLVDLQRTAIKDGPAFRNSGGGTYNHNMFWLEMAPK